MDFPLICRGHIPGIVVPLPQPAPASVAAWVQGSLGDSSWRRGLCIWAEQPGAISLSEEAARPQCVDHRLSFEAFSAPSPVLSPGGTTGF